MILLYKNTFESLQFFQTLYTLEVGDGPRLTCPVSKHRQSDLSLCDVEVLGISCFVLGFSALAKTE